MIFTKRKRDSEILDVTSGPILIRMIKFAIPIFFSGVLQQTFNTADSIVIGRFAGSDALGGISVTAAAINLLVNFFMGLSVGASVAISQNIGAGRYREANIHAHNAIATALWCGIFIAILGNIVCRPVLVAMGTPSENLAYAEKYMRIYFAGVPAVLLYNYGSAIMRTMGDTKRPLFYLAIGGVANVILNLIFVLGFGMDTDGVAIATIASNVIAAAFVIYNLTNSSHFCRIDLQSVKIHKHEFKRIMNLGLPTGIQSAMFSFSNMLMQSSINSFGPSATAGNAAAGNMDSYVNYVGDSFVQASLSFSGQNFGAGNYKRIKKIFIESILTSFAISLVISAIISIFRYQISALYIVDNDAAIEVSAMKIMYVCLPYAICSMMSVASSNIRAIGKSIVPMLVTVFGVCGLRIVWIYTVFATDSFHTLEVLFSIYPISWTLTFVVHLFTFIYFYKKMSSGKMKMEIG